jgi:hypothetical protein
MRADEFKSTPFRSAWKSTGVARPCKPNRESQSSSTRRAPFQKLGNYSYRRSNAANRIERSFAVSLFSMGPPHHKRGPAFMVSDYASPRFNHRAADETRPGRDASRAAAYCAPHETLRRAKPYCLTSGCGRSSPKRPSSLMRG